MQVDDFRVFFINTYSDAARVIICEVYNYNYTIIMFFNILLYMITVCRQPSWGSPTLAMPG